MSALPIKKWSREEFSRLIATDLLDADHRYELIEGLVLELMTHNPPHVTAVALVDGWLRSIVPDGYFVRSQSPIALDDHSEPEPDAAVVRGRIQDYARRHPEPSEIELVVEVSDSSLERDRKVKAPLYARVGIRELWIIDLVDRKLELHRDPGPDGYRVVTILAETGAAAPIFAPVDAVNVSALLPS